MSTPFALPEALIARFRAVSFERLERIDAAWLALTQGTATATTEQELHHDLHTLKGDARVVGFAEVGLLCHRLEDLLFAARDKRYRVHDDVDIVVTMAIQFIGMLLRKKAGASKGGIDLDGFLKQIEGVLHEWLSRSSEAPSQSVPVMTHLRLADVPTRVTSSARARLSEIATTVYLEHLRADAGSKSRARLRGVWKALACEIAELDAVALEPIMKRHATAGEELAAHLGKQMSGIVEVGEVKVAVEVLETLNAAVIHAVRNAVDHGIESPATRQELGKPQIGTVRIEARYVDDGVELSVRDDGAGVHLERVRSRAVAKDLLPAAAAASASRQELLELLFHPGFSTRELANEVSGRGIGLDAVRSSVVRHGGRITLETREGEGTSITLWLPQTHPVTDVLAAKVDDGLTICFSTSWQASIADGRNAHVTNPLDLLELSASLRSPSGPMHTVRLQRDNDDVCLAVAAPPTAATATRLCPTPPDSPLEVVEIDGVEVILIRPDVLIVLAQAEA